MKKIVIITTLLIAAIFTKAQMKQQTISIINGEVSGPAMSALIDTMGDEQIVGLGEGTHGTKEFNELRISIIKQLITNKGFTVLCFENSFGDSYYLNEVINSNDSMEPSMKKYMIKLWQTPEIRDFLYWLRDYNNTHERKVTFAGMDFNFIASTTDIIQNELKNCNNATLVALAEKLHCDGVFYDSIWSNQNDTNFAFSFDTLVAKMREGYKATKKIDSIVKANNIAVSINFSRAVLNCRAWINGEENRDSCMAQMAASFATNENVIVWAHAVHLALQSPFADNSVGGTGGYIKKIIPSYFALGTGTADGTYSGTEERFDTRTNPMHIYNLPAIDKNSWDKYFTDENKQAILIQLNNLNNSGMELPLRLIGYGPPKGIDYTDKIKLSRLFDAYIFIKHTNANSYID